ncbi:MAG: hypothetical protein ABIH49_02435 [archaeon]
MTITEERAYDEKAEDIRVISECFRLNILRTARELRARTTIMDESFPYLQANQMPEYQKALDAIRKYAEVIQSKMESIIPNK